MNRAAKAAIAILSAVTAVAAIVGISASGRIAAQTSDPSVATSSPEADATTELHAIGIYEGYIKSAGQIHGSRADVVVDRPGKLVILSLSAHERTTWLVEATPGTTIIKVILGGSDRQVVKGLSSDTVIIDAYRDKSARVVVPYAYDQDSPEFRKYVKVLTQETGTQLSSFHGAYYAHAGMPFIVDAVDQAQLKARLSPDYPQPTPVSELPDISYSAILRRGDETLYGRFTQAGPVMESMRRAPSGATHIAFDPERKRYYAIKGGDVVEFDPVMGTTTPMDAGMDVPELSSPCGIAFDTARHRLLVASPGGEGFLYAYDPATQLWSVVTSLYDADLSALTYDPTADVLYGMVVGDGRMRVKKFTAAGQPIEDIPLSGQIMPSMLGGRYGHADVQLVTAGKYLVLIASETGEEDHKVTKRTFIVEADTGKTLLARVE